jgi:catechol 2,3-dioxygenase-like lactoylglutathione lyase family enzyme
MGLPSCLSRPFPLSPLFCFGVLAASVAMLAHQPAAPTPAREPLAHFHHVHLNSTDPEAAIAYYTKHFASERAQFTGSADKGDKGIPAVWTQKSWVLFDKVKQAPPSAVVSSIYHMGWGAEDMKAESRRQLEMGAVLETPLTDAVDIFGAGVRDRNFFMYVASPEHALIEVQSATHHNFMHVHLLSEDPVAASEWYEKEFGLIRRGQPNRQTRVFAGIPTGPSASLIADNVTFFWYPTAHARAIYPRAWEGRTQYESNRGRVIDHFALSVDRLDETIARLKNDGVMVIGKPRKSLGGRIRSVFVKAPDNVEIELVEGHATRR